MSNFLRSSFTVERLAFKFEVHCSVLPSKWSSHSGNRENHCLRDRWQLIRIIGRLRRTCPCRLRQRTANS